MTGRPTRKLHAYLWGSAVGLLAALAAGRPAAAAVVAPLGAAAAAGLLLARRPSVAVRETLASARAVEGDGVELRVHVASPNGAGTLELRPRAPAGLEPEPRDARLTLGRDRAAVFTLRASRWGAYEVCALELAVSAPLGMVVWESAVPARHRLVVLPASASLRALTAPAKLHAAAGNRVARRAGTGTEFAGVRPYRAGDPLNHIHWRATARRGTAQVAERHAERAGSVVVLFDSFGDVDAPRGGTLLGAGVRAAGAIAARHVAYGDRVGLLVYGGTVEWVRPATGRAQALRILDALLRTEVTPSAVWRDVTRVPRRVLPPAALVLAVSPLLDPRAGSALLDLRARGFDVAVLELDPVPLVPPGRDREARAAHRLWRLDRDARRDRFRRAGVAVVPWAQDAPLETAVREVTAFRRSALRV